MHDQRNIKKTSKLGKGDKLFLASEIHDLEQTTGNKSQEINP